MAQFAVLYHAMNDDLAYW